MFNSKHTIYRFHLFKQVDKRTIDIQFFLSIHEALNFQISRKCTIIFSLRFSKKSLYYYLDPKVFFDNNYL